MVRAKFRVLEVLERRHANDNGKHAVVVEMRPVAKEGAPENAIFGEYTPSGAISMTIYNPEASAQFIPGREYYVDFTLAE